MPIENGTIVVKDGNGVAIKDVQNALQTAQVPESTIRLCTHPSINKWSKHKPIRYQGQKVLEESNYIQNNYGLGFASKNVISELESYVTNGGDGFPYLRPQGGTSQPYRLSDFIGYVLTNDDGGIDGSIYSKASVKKGDNVGCSVTWSRSNAKNILLSDLLVSDYHLGMVFFCDGLTPKICACSQSLSAMTKEEDDESVWLEFEIAYPTSESRTYKVLPVLTSSSDPSLGNANSSLSAIPLANRFFNVNVVPDSVVEGGVEFSFDVDVYGTYTTLTFSIANNSDNDLTVTDLYFGIMTEQSYDNDSSFLDAIFSAWIGSSHTAPSDYGNPIVFRAFGIYNLMRNSNTNTDKSVIKRGETLTFSYNMAYVTDGCGYSYENFWGCFFRKDSACNFNGGYYVD